MVKLANREQPFDYGEAYKHGIGGWIMVRPGKQGIGGQIMVKPGNMEWRVDYE